MIKIHQSKNGSRTNMYSEERRKNYKIYEEYLGELYSKL